MAVATTHTSHQHTTSTDEQLVGARAGSGGVKHPSLVSMYAAASLRRRVASPLPQSSAGTWHRPLVRMWGWVGRGGRGSRAAGRGRRARTSLHTPARTRALCRSVRRRVRSFGVGSWLLPSALHLVRAPAPSPLHPAPSALHPHPTLSTPPPAKSYYCKNGTSLLGTEVANSPVKLSASSTDPVNALTCRDLCNSRAACIGYGGTGGGGGAGGRGAWHAPLSLPPPPPCRLLGLWRSGDRVGWDGTNGHCAP